MMKITSALLLLLWTSCYLNCSMEQFGVCADSLFSSVESSDSCPLEQGNDAPDTCEDSEFVILSQESNAVSDTPVRDLSDEINFLAQLLARKNPVEESAPVNPNFFDPEFSRSEQDCIRDSRPIRGPSV